MFLIQMDYYKIPQGFVQGSNPRYQKIDITWYNKKTTRM